MAKTSNYSLIFMILFLVINITEVKSQEAAITLAQNPIKISNLEIPYAAQDIILDGELNDAIWEKALPVSLDIVNSPWENLASPVVTTAKLIENGKYLYVAFIAKDPEPSKIQGFLGDRDTKWFDDVVGIKLDTHNNRRLNYEFFVNPFGVQNDAIYSEITSKKNTLWDGIWHSYGKITDSGYQVEMAIPYNILNFEENGKTKKWAIELVRVYPRETTLRISHIPLDRNNPCWLCQYPEAIGFKNASIGNNIRLTPTLTVKKNETRDIYTPSDKWHSDEEIKSGMDLRWGIDANTSFNATINPDFSTVEADAGQLNVNKTFSLFYKEKRAFFLDNSDYFDSNYDLVYTRNIVSPNYGAKLTGRIDKHNYGVFITDDSETNFLMPGNLGSDIASLHQKSQSSALRYRFDYNDNLSLGAITTLRKSENYHNYLTGIDGKYRFDDSNWLQTQLLTSQTEYPDDLYKTFCLTDECNTPEKIDCTFGNCPFTEQVIRSKIQGEFNDQAYRVDFNHKSEYWRVKLSHENIGEDFRADLGYLPKVDIKQNKALIKRTFYSEQGSTWQTAKVLAQWHSIKNSHNEFIENNLEAKVNIDGPKQSFFEAIIRHADKVGLRDQSKNLSIDHNTSRFTENQLNLYASVQAHAKFYVSADFTIGDKIDYNNDRLGSLQQFIANVTWNLSNHLEINLSQTYSKLDADNINPQLGNNVYSANLSDLRVSYQFDVQSYLKLSIVYTDIDRNPDNNPYINVNKENKELSTQLIYAYKLNPQTVFFLGYSDSSYQDDYLNRLQREQRTFFSKISYSWMP